MSSRKITSGGKERLAPTVNLYAPIFKDDPVITYMLCSMPNDAARLAYLPGYFHVLLKAAALNNASFDEIEDFQSCGVMMPPGRRVDNTWTLIPAGFIQCLWKLGISGCQRMLLEFTPRADTAKAKVLATGEKYYYLFFIGTRDDCKGKGLASDLIRNYQHAAREANLPIWLEATTAHSRDLYMRLDFKIVEEIVLGKNKASAGGKACKGGEGVKIWAMIWRPEQKAEAT